MNRIQIWLSAVICAAFFAIVPARGQVETAATIGVVTSGLSTALGDFKSAMETGGGEIRGAGNSLQANAQNVLSDIDRVFGDNVNLTFDRMDTQQRALYRDAQALTRQIQRASTAVVHNGGVEARATIGDADILAYNTSYSLPCRTQTARIVYVATPRVRVGQDVTEVVVRGNFLDNNPETKIRVAGAPATVIARSTNEIRLAIPASVTSAVTDERSVPIVIEGRTLKRTNFWLFCSSRNVPVSLSTSAVIAPRQVVTIAAWVQPTTMAEEAKSEAHEYDSGAPGDCGINVDASQQVCAPEGWKVAAVSGFTITGRNCGSNAGPATVSGARCVHVPGRLRGCGYDSFLGIRNCKGRGWLSWKMNVGLTREVRKDAPRQTFDATSDSQTSWSFPYQPAAELVQPTWKYGARITVTEGTKSTTYEVSQAQESVGPISARLIDGTLSIVLEE